MRRHGFWAVMTLTASAAGAQAPTSVVPPPLQSIEREIDAQDADPEAAAAAAVRRRLNAEVAARADAARAAYAASLAEHRAAAAAHEVAVEDSRRAEGEYQAARAAYEQRQREIADWQACVGGEKSRCPAEREQR